MTQMSLGRHEFYSSSEGKNRRQSLEPGTERTWSTKKQSETVRSRGRIERTSLWSQYRLNIVCISRNEESCKHTTKVVRFSVGFQGMISGSIKNVHILQFDLQLWPRYFYSESSSTLFWNARNNGVAVVKTAGYQVIVKQIRTEIRRPILRIPQILKSAEQHIELLCSMNESLSQVHLTNGRINCCFLRQKWLGGWNSKHIFVKYYSVYYIVM